MDQFRVEGLRRTKIGFIIVKIQFRPLGKHKHKNKL